MGVSGTFVAITGQTSPGILGSTLIGTLTFTGSTTTGTISVDTSKYSRLMYLFTGKAAGACNCFIQMNGDGGANYNYAMIKSEAAAVGANNALNQTQVQIGGLSGTTGGVFSGYISNDGTNATIFNVMAGGDAGTTVYTGMGRWSGTAKITSITFLTNAVNIDAISKLLIYGVA